MLRDLGRHVFGVAAITYGILTLYWQNVKTWPQLQAFGNTPHFEFVMYLTAAAALAGGFAIQWRRTAQFGAAILGALFLAFSVFYIPHIFAAPKVYDSWGNFFEQFSLFSGALIAYASLAVGRAQWAAGAATAGRICFGICVASFTLEQAFYLGATAGLVPKWIPPGQMFWALATTVAFALAAIAIVSGRYALVAARLLTAMLVLFGALIWLPAVLTAPGSHFNWSEGAENLAIAGAAWILADSLTA